MHLSLLAALILGLVQGFTEFLPVSSSAHLVFAQHFLHLHLPADDTVAFDVLLHLGTLAAVLVYFRKDVKALLIGAGALLVKPKRAWRADSYSRLAAWLVLGTIPAAVAGVKWRHFFEAAFQSVPGTAVLLLVTAVMLFWITRRQTGARKLETTTWKDALLIGCFQAVAILPGVSRSGATITGGLLRGFDREAAPRFSFLLAIPIILGGGLKAAKDALGAGLHLPLPALAVGFLAAAVSGYLAVALLFEIVRRERLAVFAYYCAVVGLGMLLYWQLLVPQVAVSAIKVLAGRTPLQVVDGELGPARLGDKLLLQLPVRSALVPFEQADVLIQAAHTHIVSQKMTNQGGITLVNVELSSLHPTDALWPLSPDGKVEEMLVILRNQWGIENTVTLRLLILPESPEDRLAARMFPAG